MAAALLIEPLVYNAFLFFFFHYTFVTAGKAQENVPVTCLCVCAENQFICVSMFTSL